MLSLGEKMCCVSSPVCLCVCLFVLCVCLCVRVEMYLCVCVFADCIGEGMFDVTPCLWSPCAPSERSCVITGSAGTSEFHFMLSSQLTHSVDLPRAPSRCSSIFVEFISGEH